MPVTGGKVIFFLSPLSLNFAGIYSNVIFQKYAVKITLSPKGHEQCKQREIKLESTTCHLGVINDFVTFIGIREE